ncbi:MAG TPA: hypothetical protein VK390_03790, partial [Propionibacteriaceae bacterium]|nr:hypothetical protein [Propionibacteriaceae bacterium]
PLLQVLVASRPATAPDDREANGWAGAKRFVVGPLEVQFAELGIQASSLGAGPTADLRYHAEKGAST